MSRTEIEQELQGKGDFVQIDYLIRFLKENPVLEIKKFCFLKLAELYENVKMFNEAAKMYEGAAGISIAFTEKIKNYLKETELYIKAGSFDKADFATKKALAEANTRETEEIYATVKRFYRDKAETFEKEMKKNHAAKTYEKMLELRLSEQERKEIREKLMDIYKELGRNREYMLLERGL